MAGYKVQLKDEDGNYQYPVTSTDIVVNAEGINVEDLLGRKQDKLISGQNIKTINGQSILGGGDIVITSGTGGIVSESDPVFSASPASKITDEDIDKWNSGTGSSDIIVDSSMSDTSTNPVQNKVIKAYVDNVKGGGVVYREIKGMESLAGNAEVMAYNKETLALAEEMKVIPYRLVDGVATTFTSYSFGGDPLTAHLEYHDAENETISKWIVHPNGDVTEEDTIQITNRAARLSDSLSALLEVKDMSPDWQMPVCSFTEGDPYNSGGATVNYVKADLIKNELHVVAQTDSLIRVMTYTYAEDGTIVFNREGTLGRIYIGGAEELTELEKSYNAYNYKSLIGNMKRGVSFPFYLFDGNYNFYLIISYNWINSECTIIKNGAFETYKLTEEGLCYKI